MWLLGILLLVILVWIIWKPGDAIRSTLEWIQNQGAIGVLVFGAVYVLACVLLIPGSILTLGAGVLYGPLLGSVYVSVASVLGATISFLMGRFLVRDWVVQKFGSDPRFASLDDAVGQAGWRMVVMLRLSPVFPFNVLNYALGLTQVRLLDYVLASWIGMLPGTVLFVYIGSLLGWSVIQGGQSEHPRSTLEWVFYGVGMLATVWVTYSATQMARKALSKRLPEPHSHS